MFILLSCALCACSAPTAVPTAVIEESSASNIDSVCSDTPSPISDSSDFSVSDIHELPGESTVESTEPAIDILGKVHGIRNISTYEGMRPDPMSGIEWDDEYVQSVTADDSLVDWDKEGNYMLTYIVQGDHEQRNREISVKIRKNLEDYLYGMEGRAKILPEDVDDYSGLEDVLYEESEMEITADTSRLRSDTGDYIIVYELKGKDGHVQTLNRIISVVDSIEEESYGTLYVDDGTYSTMTDLGIWRLTAYMDTPEDQGPYVGQTASGLPLVAGRTVAVSAATCARHGLSFGDKLMINGHIYTLEDHGGSAMYDQDWVDIFVDNVEDEYSEAFNQYSHVYLLR